MPKVIITLTASLVIGLPLISSETRCSDDSHSQ